MCVCVYRERAGDRERGGEERERERGRGNNVLLVVVKSSYRPNSLPDRCRLDCLQVLVLLGLSSTGRDIALVTQLTFVRRSKR